MADWIETDIKSGVAFATLNRPDKRNALTRAVIEELDAFVAEVDGNDAVRLFVLRGNGKVFCAGMDLAEMQSRADADDPEKEWQIDSDVYNQLVSRIFALKIPTLAVLQGPVLAGGTGMVFACDMVLASENAFIALPEPKRGIVAAMVAPLLVFRTGMSTASYLLMSGKSLTAKEAAGHGLLHEVVAEENLDQARTLLIESILTGSNSALRSTKEHLRSLASANVVEQIRASSSVSAIARKSEDAQEGLAAFNEKRKPNWEVKLD